MLNATTGAIVNSIKLDGTNGYPKVAANSVEATIYNTARSTHFLAAPALTSDSQGHALGTGGAFEVDTATGTLLHTYDFAALGLAGTCTPTGLVQGAGATMSIACSDPAATGSVLLNPAGNGSSTIVPGINTFFEAARFQPGGPVLGVIDPTTGTLQTLPIGINDHSVAVDPVTDEVFVATGPTTAFANCTNGCIGVFAQVNVPEPSTLPIFAMALAGLGAAGWFSRRVRPAQRLDRRSGPASGKTAWGKTA